MMMAVHAAQTSTPGANINDGNSEAIVPLATGGESPSSENRPRRRRRRGALNLDGRTLKIVRTTRTTMLAALLTIDRRELFKPRMTMKEKARICTKRVIQPIIAPCRF